MKQAVRTLFTTISRDRWLMGLLVANIVIAIVFSVIIAITIKPNESQVITRYTAYGIASYHRNHWYALFGYVGLSLVLAIGHGFLAAKLSRYERRDLAMAVLWLTLGMQLILLIYAQSIIKIAALG